MGQRRNCDKKLTVCSLFWLGPVTNEELEEEAAHDQVLGKTNNQTKTVSLLSSEPSVVY